MQFNATLFGQAAFVLIIISLSLTLFFARQAKPDNFPLVAFYSVILNIFLLPVGLIYCGFWSVQAYRFKLNTERWSR